MVDADGDVKDDRSVSRPEAEDSERVRFGPGTGLTRIPELSSRAAIEDCDSDSDSDSDFDFTSSSSSLDESVRELSSLSEESKKTSLISRYC